MTERVEKEQQRNLALLADSQPVYYGKTVQLRHTHTGKFVEVLSTDGAVELADVERECMKVGGYTRWAGGWVGWRGVWVGGSLVG
jgi:hypothetical protein